LCAGPCGGTTNADGLQSVNAIPAATAAGVQRGAGSPAHELVGTGGWLNSDPASRRLPFGQVGA
jgi:hypothetical protein